MSARQVLLRVCAVVALMLAAYGVLAMLTQAMLGGVSDADVWRSRIYFWWVYFLASGFLVMFCVYAWRASGPALNPQSSIDGSSQRWRLGLFPSGHLLLTAGLYMLDLGWYGEQHSQGAAHTLYSIGGATLGIAAGAVFWTARRLGKPRQA